MTRHPLARSSWAVSWPRMPRPMTTKVSPSVGWARRTPWSAMAPSVTVLASANAEPVGNAHHEVARDADDLGVVRSLRAGARDAIADVQVVDALADLDDTSGRRVAGRLAAGELALDHARGCTDALGRRVPEDLHDLVRLA